MNTYELAHEFYEAQLHSDNGIPYQNALTEERDTDARIVSHTVPGAILLDVKIKIATGNLILMRRRGIYIYPRYREQGI